MLFCFASMSCQRCHMSNTTTPPRFVPTLTEAVSDSALPTEIEDLSYLETRDAPDSMLDLNLDDLGQDPTPTQVEHFAPLGAHKKDEAVAVAATGTEQQPALPPDWQAQLQHTLRQAVRQELQQQLPFLLLQWSKQIEDKVTPQIQRQLVKMLQGWQTPAD